MPLDQYGVVLGSLADFTRDPPDNFGRFFHGHVKVNVPGGVYNCAVDVDVPTVGVRVQWRIQHLRAGEWGGVFGLPDGYHSLASNETSGAVDYIRDSRLFDVLLIPDYVDGPIPPWWPPVPPEPPWTISERFTSTIRTLFGRTAAPVAVPRLMMSRTVRRVVRLDPVWKTGSGEDALNDLQVVVTGAARVVVFGQKYPAQGANPPGLHDIHQNQGDPAGRNGTTPMVSGRTA